MFDPRDFRAVATRCVFELAATSGDAAYRTAISRSYYAAFLLARDRMVQNHGLRIDRERSLHKQVLDKLRTVDFDTWEDLKRLQSLRVEADYNLLYQSAGADVQDALDYSEQVINAMP